MEIPSIIIAVIVLFIIGPYLVNIIKIKKGRREAIWQLLKYNRFNPAFSLDDKGQLGNKFIFAPHPFTNWSLNPTFVNRYGERVHTLEGFRKTQEDDSILEMLNKKPDSLRIVCIGGSSTHCQEIERYQNTWPAKIKGKLQRKGIQSTVFNFGIGGWGTLHSLIRCSTWLPLIKPDILVFYQAKNDLTPLANGSEREDMVYPDCQNIMGQFSECLNINFPKFLFYIPLFFLLFYLLSFRRLQSQYDGLLSIYRPEAWKNPAGFNRLNNNYKESVLFRTETIIHMCQAMNCKVLYIPEIVRSGEYATILNDEIYPEIRNRIKKFNNIQLFEAKDVFPDSDKYFYDKMHFREEGCDLFSEIVSNQISELIKKYNISKCHESK